MAFSAVSSKAVVLLLFIYCLFYSRCLWGIVFGACFVMQYVVSFLVLQPSRWGRESWLLKFYRLLDVMWLFFLSPRNMMRRGSRSVIALCLFLKVPWVGLQCVIVAFPGHAHLLSG